MKSELRILNLEENERDAELNAAMLTARWPQSEFLRVDTPQDYIAALVSEGHLDLILSDYTMPGFNGREALTLARQYRPEAPFLFVSGTIGEDAAIEVLKNGAMDYVLKHRLMRLIPAVARALAEAEVHDERKRAEWALCESEHKYHTLFERLGDAALLVEEHGGKIIDANRQTGVLLHCFRSEILGRKETQFLEIDPCQKSEADLSGKTVDCKVVRSNGTTIPIRIRTTRLTLHGRPLVLRLFYELDPASAR
jgi:CheY-like chemotaxis protein